MGFRKPDLEPAYNCIRHCIGEIRSPHNDGYISAGCKQELYQLKCWLEDQYAALPYFEGERDWEAARIVQILKQE
jgi:hypothetical protein